MDGLKPITLPDKNGINSIPFESPLHRLARHLAKSAHFPADSTLATCLGVYSAALVNRGVTVEHCGATFPTGLYLVVTGDPGAGKSLVLKRPSKALNTAYKKLNAERAKQRRKLSRQIAHLEKQLEALDPFEDEQQSSQLDEQIAALKAQKQANFELMLGLSDATPAATNALALNTGGVVNYCSAEPDLFYSLFNTSGDKGADKSMILHGFDGGQTTTARVTRQGYNGTVKSALVCMAQPSALHELMQEQNDGRGVIERFLLVDEKQPPRDLTKQHQIPQSIQDDWEQLARRTAGIYPGATATTPIHLRLTDQDDARIIQVAQEVENQCTGASRFASSLMKSVGRKCRIQIAKLAGILYMTHTQGSAPAPATDEGETRTISRDCVTAAIAYWWAFIGMFEGVAIDTGTGGQNALVDGLAHMLKLMRKRGQIQTLRDFCVAASRQRKGHILKPYTTKQAMGDLLQQAIQRGWVVPVEKGYYISPEI